MSSRMKILLFSVKVSLISLTLVTVSFFLSYVVSHSDEIRNFDELWGYIGCFVLAFLFITVFAIYHANNVGWPFGESPIQRILSLVFPISAFFLPLIFATTPLTKSYNRTQLDKDDNVVESMKIDLTESKLKIILPADINDYAGDVLFLGANPNNLVSWKQKAICIGTAEKLFEATFCINTCSDNNKVTLFLKFDHAWKDREIVLSP